MTARVAALALCALAGCSAPPRPAAAVDPFVAAYRSVRPSVVLFTMNVPSEDPKLRRQRRTDEAYGSGVVVASDARGSRILTEQHVIDGASDLRATLDGGKTVPARVIAADADRDLALVAVATPNLPAAALGTSAGIEPGQPVGVSGFPIPDAFEDEHLGTKPSVFAGRVSSIRRDSLELDLPVIPGESGGPVFDARTGVVIALAQSRFDEEKAIGFAIPIDVAKRFLARTDRAALVTGSR